MGNLGRRARFGMGLLSGVALGIMGCGTYLPRYETKPMPNIPISDCTHQGKNGVNFGLEIYDTPEEWNSTSGVLFGGLPVYVRVYNSSQNNIKILGRESYIRQKDGERWSNVPLESIFGEKFREGGGVERIIIDSLLVPKIIVASRKIAVFAYNKKANEDIKNKMLPNVVEVAPNQEIIGFLAFARDNPIQMVPGRTYPPVWEYLVGGQLHFYLEEGGERKEYSFELGKPRIVLGRNIEKD